MTTDLTVAAAFDGVGGFDLAFERAGATPKVTVEVDKQARGVLTEHWPNITHLEDITKVTADDIRAAGFVPERGILTAGFPCQDLSVAGRRAGMVEGTRSGLYWHLDRLVAELRPAWIVYENVPGLLSSTCPCRGDGSCEMDNGRPFRCPRAGLHTVPGGACVGGCIASHGGTMGAVLGSVGNRGYGFAYRVLDAQGFGVPQRRRRVFIVGRLGDDGTAPAQVLLDVESSVGDSAARPQTWTRPPGRPRGSARGFGVSAGQDDVAGTLLSNNDGGLRTTDISGAYVVEPEVQTFRKAGRAQTNQDDETWVEDDAANTVNTFDVGDTRATELVVTKAEGVAFNQRREARTSTEQLVHVTPVAMRGRDGDNLMEAGAPGDPAHALRSADGGSSAPMVAVTPVQDTREGDKNQNGVGFGDHGDPAYTVDTVSRQGVAVTPITTKNATRTAEHDSAGTGIGAEGDPAPTVGTSLATAVSITASYGEQTHQDHFNHAAAGSLPVTAGVVRRLTPLECERLQGYPDNWTKTSGGKEQADSPRYKQMGNSLAVPCVEWIAHRLVTVDRMMNS